MLNISSPTNPHIKHFIKLQKKSYRDQHQEFIAEGVRTCSTLMQHYIVKKVFMTHFFFHNQKSINFNEEAIYLVSDQIMKKMSSAANFSGICAIFSKPDNSNLPTSGPGLVLVDINDPGNMGTIIRSAAAMDITSIVCIDGVDPYHPKVIQSTAGCIGRVKICQTSWNTLILQKLHLCALVVHQGKHPNKLNLKNSLLVLGNEAQGLSNEHIAQCQEKMTIPMPGNTESLNVAIAGSIALYIITQQN
jgi:TrmH family RNA methyltransferase